MADPEGTFLLPKEQPPGCPPAGGKSAVETGPTPGTTCKGAGRWRASLLLGIFPLNHHLSVGDLARKWGWDVGGTYLSSGSIFRYFYQELVGGH